MANTKKMVKIDKTATFVPVVGSSLVSSYARIGNDLALKFNNGGNYVYRGVDVKTMESFVAAESKGKFFASSIRNKFIAEQAE
jgi:hypothetical protein